MLRNLLVEMRYNGAAYHGYQIQKNALTITEVVQDAIEAILHRREPIVGCSRTDTGVHANSYFFNMKTACGIPEEKFIMVMNRELPKDIAILSCKEVPLDFHSRYDCKGKEYIYKIFNTAEKDPFQADLVLQHGTYIDAEKLEKIAQVLVGRHDFTSFCSLGGKVESNIRTIDYIKIWRKGEYVYIKVKADGFLYHMVRIIVGTLLHINDGKIPPDGLGKILEKRDRNFAGKTAPPQGLYLNQIIY